MAIDARIVEDREAWENYVLAREEANFLQSWMWADVNEKLGKKAYRMGYFEGETLIGVMVAVVEPARRGRYISVAAGPIIDWSRADIVEAWRDSLVMLTEQEDCVFVRVRPQLLALDANEQTFSKLGFRPAKMHLEAELTSQLKLDVSLDELNQNLRKNTRRDIKQAKKRGIKVTQLDDPSIIKEFHEMQLETAKRHDFVPFSYDRLQAEFDVFSETGNVLLYSAHTSEGELIAQAFVVFYGAEASYHYGASTELGRTEPGAYLIQWKAIQEAMMRGCKRYNFWGVVRPDDTKHRFYGVSVFKRGFRGDDVEYLHAHDLVIKRSQYLKNYAIETARKKARRL
ncbi:MAG: peptidoglycan bridge formation glycyltransferase FemA/FemB family protein [Actinomycetia bacterium]|nr:peptidoglycan bridge formation glycyltransferase FemA/FemB family protein [Actinomycetes bacterium]